MMKEEKEHEFWPDNIAKKLVDSWKTKTQVITTGTSMSGEPHIGNANDVRGDVLGLAANKLGQKAVFDDNTFNLEYSMPMVYNSQGQFVFKNG